MSDSINKRQIKKRREEQRAAKLERRQARSEGVVEKADEDALLERFRLLNEARASGAIHEESFQAQSRDLMTALGIDTHGGDAE